MLRAEYPDERQRARATGSPGWVACHMGEDGRLDWPAIPAWMPAAGERGFDGPVRDASGVGGRLATVERADSCQRGGQALAKAETMVSVW